MSNASSQAFTDKLLTRFGPTLGGHDLYAALGFKSYAAFHRSKQRNEIGVNVFTLPGRRGWFALTVDVSEWLYRQADSQREPIAGEESTSGDAK